MRVNAFGRVTRLMKNVCKWIVLLEKKDLATFNDFKYMWHNNREGITFDMGAVTVIFETGTNRTTMKYTYSDVLFYDSKQWSENEDNAKLIIGSVLNKFETFISNTVNFLNVVSK